MSRLAIQDIQCATIAQVKVKVQVQDDVYMRVQEQRLELTYPVRSTLCFTSSSSPTSGL